MQRVQINIIESGLTLDKYARLIKIAFCSRDDSSWREIPALDFFALVNAAQELRSVSDAAWRNIQHRICIAETAPRFEFAKHDTLINIGAPAGIDDYFLRIRNLKQRLKIKYVAFVYDCDSLAALHHCSENLTKEFGAWIEGLFRHADYFLVNSRATETDLLECAANLKHDPPNIHVVGLDGQLNAELSAADDGIDDRSRLRSVFEANDIAAGGSEPPKFVLFVSTLESRKNHIVAFSVWDQLIAKLGIQNTPYLLGLGEHGWMFDTALVYLKERPKLERRVRFLSGVDGNTLSALYNQCEFTPYLSHHEGWGLLVVESLCHGKVPVVANVSSLREAGGSFALYFDPLAPRVAHVIVERLIADEGYRLGLEAKIKAGFQPRPWHVIAADVLSVLSRVETVAAQPKEKSFPAWIERIEPGVIYEISKPTSEGGLSAQSGIHMRLGAGWLPCEDWGAWTCPGESRLAFVFPDKDCHELTVYLQLKGAPGKGSSVEVVANFSMGSSRPRSAQARPGGSASFFRFPLTLSRSRN
jgi:glycosyltransferase involved in cell wall biosynthesis